jgi:hypothetical protein
VLPSLPETFTVEAFVAATVKVDDAPSVIDTGPAEMLTVGTDEDGEPEPDCVPPLQPASERTSGRARNKDRPKQNKRDPRFMGVIHFFDEILLGGMEDVMVGVQPGNGRPRPLSNSGFTRSLSR